MLSSARNAGGRNYYTDEAKPNMPIEYQNIDWPPAGWQTVQSWYALWDAWYSGDVARLATVYSTLLANPYSAALSMYARKAHKERMTTLHVPVAGDLSRTSATFLFSERPNVIVEGAGEITEAGQPKNPDADAVHERLQSIIEASYLWSKMTEAAEAASPMGGVWLKVDWDEALADFPILSIVQTDNAIPEYRHGFLVAATFWRALEDNGSTVLRLLERHEPGVIYYALYKGTTDKLGRQVDLSAHPATATLAPVQEGIDGELLCRYVPNMRPNRLTRRVQEGMSADCHYIGQSDYSGCETLFESMDEVYTKWMRDIRICGGRIMVPAEWLKVGAGGKREFDVDQEVFIALDTMPSLEGHSGITTAQFEIRSEQFASTANNLYRQIVTNAGYSPQTFGLDIQGQAESGTALSIREAKSFKTSAAKADFWKPILQDIFYLMERVDVEKLGGRYMPLPVTVEMQDGIKSGVQDIAPSLELLSRAGAASTYILVKSWHPDWSEDAVQAEVKRIQDEKGLGAFDPMQIGLD
jgi:hypothetical protein